MRCSRVGREVPGRGHDKVLGLAVAGGDSDGGLNQFGLRDISNSKASGFRHGHSYYVSLFGLRRAVFVRWRFSVSAVLSPPAWRYIWVLGGSVRYLVHA